MDHRLSSGAGRGPAASLSRSPPRLALALAGAAVCRHDLHRLAKAQNGTLTRAAKQLVSWVATGLQPSIDDLIALTAKDRGLLTAPSRAAITRARASFPSVRRHSDIIIALALAQHGYAKAAAAALTEPLTPANPLTD